MSFSRNTFTGLSSNKHPGTAGNPIPLVKGLQRASLRAIDESHPRHKSYLPFRPFRKSDESFPESDKVYDMIVEIWPTNVIISKGNQLVLEVSPKDSQGGERFRHLHPKVGLVFPSQSLTQ